MQELSACELPYAYCKLEAMVPQILLPRKAVLERLIVPAIVVFVGLGAFGLGRLSVVTQTSACVTASSR